MKIVLATPLIPPEIGGPATYTKELVERLHGRYELGVVAYASTAEKLPGAALYTVSKRRVLPVRLVKFFFTLLGAARGADVIYVQNAVAAGLPAVLVGSLRRIPVVLKFVGDEAWERASQANQTRKRLEEFLRAPEGGFKIRLMMMLEGFVLRRAAVVTTPSAYLREELIATYRVKPGRAVVNYNAAEETEAAPFAAVPERHKVVTTARLTNWKGVDGLLRAMKLLRARYPDATLAVAGDGPELENLKKLSQELGSDGYVHFLGRVSRAETWHLRKSAEVYALNSTYEGLPHTVLTSFAAQIPTVATDIPGTNEAVYHERTGLLIPPGDDRALADAIGRYFDDESLRRRVVEGGSELLRDKFSWEAHLRNLTELFESLAHKP